MWKKVVPTVALCSFLLVGCNDTQDDAVVPDNNETPMEDVRDDVNTQSPNTNNGMDNGGNGTLDGGTNDNGTINNGSNVDGQPGINDNMGGNGTGTGTGNGTVTEDDRWIKGPGTDHDDDEMGR